MFFTRMSYVAQRLIIHSALLMIKKTIEVRPMFSFHSKVELANYFFRELPILAVK